MVEPGTFEVVPLAQLQRRRLVNADGSLDRDVVARVRELAAKAMVCVLDLDGLRRNKADLNTLRQMADKGNVWADAGSRFATDAMDVLVAGAERATMRWAHLARESELREAHEMSDALVLGLEFRAGVFQPNPLLRAGEQQVLALARELNLAIVIIDQEPRPGGVDRSLAARFQSTGLDRWFLGGVRDGGDARELQALGYRGCLVAAEQAQGVWL